MSSHSSRPCPRAATVALCMMLACVAFACLLAGTAKASYYKMVLCAANNGSNSFQTQTNTTSPQNPNGIFSFQNYCGPAPYPAGNTAFLRIMEDQDSGNAGYTAYGQMSWTAPPYVSIAAAGGYSREPDQFNDGWRGRFWAEGYDGSTNNILMQGSGVENGSCGGVCWAKTSTFASHLWQFPGYGNFKRFVFELTCFRQAGCDRSGWNTVEANTMVLILNDTDPSHVSINDTSFLSGAWSRGNQNVDYNWSEHGSGIRFERVRVDGGERFSIDHIAAGQCNGGRDSADGVGEFARNFQPCPTADNIGRSYTLDTASLSDGAHTVQVCTQDYGQWQGLNGSGGESCDQRAVHTDNTPPAAPAGLSIVTSNSERYLDHFGARWTLPADPGSPIAKVHYRILNAVGSVVVPEQVMAGSNPTQLGDIAGPKAAGDYRLQVWLEDTVGLTGPLATVAIPHDTTPPAAPQGLRVSAPTTEHRVASFDVAWRNVVDQGSPIDAARYQVIDASGNVVAQEKTVSADNIEGVKGIETPASPGDYLVRLWLSDAEGNVGAPATVPVPRDTTPPAAPQDLFVAPTRSSRSEAGFDLHWRDVADGGSPIAAAHYEVFAPDGRSVVGPKTVTGEGIDSIEDLQTPSGRGDYTLRLWLSDAEGNVGAPVTAPLSYECVGSPGAASARSLSAGFGDAEAGSLLVEQGEGATLAGTLRGQGDLSGQPLCVFARVTSEGGREFLGLAMSGRDGSYRYVVGSGPSREFTVANRSGQRETSAVAILRTRVHPTLELGRKVVHEGGFATFGGSIPPPDNDGVVVVMQVRDGRGHWRAFRRYRTRGGGRYSLRYRFTRTHRRTVYVVRAQVRGQSGYPYEAGNSPARRLVVVP